MRIRYCSSDPDTSHGIRIQCIPGAAGNRFATVIVDVVVPIPVDRLFSYGVPPDLRAEIAMGARVVVPFGARHLTGMVVALSDLEREGGTNFKEVVDVLDDRPAFTRELLDLTRWIADYYLCGWGEVVRAALPAGIEVESRRRLHPEERAASADAESADGLLAYVRTHPGVDVARAQRVLGSRASSGKIARLQRDGLLRVDSVLAQPKVRARTQHFVRLSKEALEAGPAQAESIVPGSRQREVLDHLFRCHQAGQEEVGQAEVISETGATGATVKSLVSRSLVSIVEREVIRTPLGDLPVVVDRPVDQPLHASQRAALGSILEAVEAGRFETFLLHGVTGSGKTEVYIHALKRVLALGRSGIVLVPEIALTPQTVQRFRSHLGDNVEVLHSRMSAGERYDVWRTLRDGVSRVVIGPRSAIMAPLPELGLVVVDEEHETSYKQYDPAPRYHARDVAVMRARLNNAVCVLGSATPSLESFQNAQSGKYRLLAMPERVPVEGGRPATLPDVHIVDLTLERKKHRLEGNLSVALRDAIGERLEREEQVILLQNRRGYAAILECQSCGWSPECRDCAVTLTVHKQRRLLRCHYCGSARRVPESCPECGALDLNPHGVGTQRVEEELEMVFPDARLLRMDLDTTRTKDAHRNILSQFRRRKADILVGTQMVAKGLDFERVTLVGIVNADTGLLLPDFRSAERTFQILTQVAGRSGRSVLKGEVVLQTRNPDHPVIRLASVHDYAGFVASELPEREQFGYPPFGRLVGVEFRGPQESSVRELAVHWTEKLRGMSSDIPILGPEPAFVPRIKRSFRYHTIIKIASDRSPTQIKHRILEASRGVGRLPKHHRIALDVDPMGLF